MHTLFEVPDQRVLLQSRLDDLLPLAVEEMLRYVSPVVYQRRTATRDTCWPANTSVRTTRS